LVSLKGRDFNRAEPVHPMKGTGFSPYINRAKSLWALAPEGSLFQTDSIHLISDPCRLL
jgi:hypothetical protein